MQKILPLQLLNSPFSLIAIQIYIKNIDIIDLNNLILFNCLYLERLKNILRLRAYILRVIINFYFNFLYIDFIIC